MCYISDIYVYLKARADGALPRDRPGSHQPRKPKSAQDAENSCMGVTPVTRSCRQSPWSGVFVAHH